MSVETDTSLDQLDQYKWGFNKPENYVFKSRKGLSHEIIEEISEMKGEPQWMRDFRHKSYDLFLKRPVPTWGGDLSEIDFDDIYYYIKPTQQAGATWDDLPAEIKDTFEQLGIPEAERKYLAGVGAQYECLTGDSRVYTARGLVPIREIQPGDTVFSFDEETNTIIPAKVRATAEKGVRDVFEVKVGTRRIKATANHPFLALAYERAEDRQRGRYTREWNYLQDLSVGDLIAVTKVLPETGADYTLQQPEIKTVSADGVDFAYRYNDVRLPQATTEDLMWWLGLYIGDGFIHYTAGADKARVEVAIPDTDPAVRDELVRATELLFGITPTTTDKYRVSINSTIVARFIEANGFAGKALEKRVPEWVFGLPQSQKLAFLGGYLDSDGYVRDAEKNHDVVLTSGNRDLLHDMTELLSLCGLPSSEIHRFESKHPTEAERMVVGYRVEVAGNFERIGSRSPRRLERLNKRKYHHDYSSAKNTKFVKHTTEFHGYAKIESITPAGAEMVYDIEVEGPHNFVAEGLIVHNSEVVYHKVREDLEKLGVIFVDPGTGLREHEELFRKYFATVIPPNDNKFAALNSAVWSGGSFIYIPKGVHVEIPLQAYFRINAQNMGQFERTLIIADEDSYVHYVEGCFLPGARVRTRNGEKPIEEVQVGDEVWTHKGRYRKVSDTMTRPYEGTIYTIRFYGDSGSELHVTEEHPLLISTRKVARMRNQEFTPEWAPVSLLKPGDYVAVPVPHPEKVTDTHHTLTIPIGRGRHEPIAREVTLPLEEDFFRLVGYYHAEGHVDNEHYLSFSFHVEEKALLEDTHALIERHFGKAASENKPRQNGQTIVLSSTEAARAFAYTFGSTVYDKRVPDFIRNAPLTHLAQWIRGAWWGDGSYDERKNMFRYNTVSSEIAYAFRDALLRLGVAASVNRQERDATRQPMYVVVISSPWNSRFGEIVGQPAPNGKQGGSPFYLDDDYLYMPIRSIEIEEMETTVHNLSVEEDESYVAEGVISHNCTAPTYTSDSLHSAVVEIIVHRNARVRYTTIQNWSKNVYNLVTKRAMAYEGATMEWVDGNLGCLSQGSTVTTPDGVRTIESLEVGDKVLSYDESAGQFVFRNVTAKRFSGMQPVHTVSVGERKLDVTANHPFYSYSYNPDVAKKLGRYNLGYVRADQLKEAIIPRTSIDYGAPHKLVAPTLTTEFVSQNQYATDLRMSRTRTTRMSPMEYTNDDVMWLFGYWVGDGNIDTKAAQTAGVMRYAKVGFSTPTTDRARERLLGTMTALVDAEPTERADGHHLAWSSKELAEFFALNGFTGKATTKRAPQWIWSTPESQRLAFIAGYLDADGCVIRGQFSLKSANRELLEDIASLLVTLGITSRLHTEFAEPRQVEIMGVLCTAHSSYRLVFAADPRFYGHISPTLRTQAQSQAPTIPQNRQVGRSSIQLPESVEIVDVDVSAPTAEPVPTWDIEVEGTGNFVSQGFIVHNSKLTMKYPAVWLMGQHARGEVLSVAFSSNGQHQDAGGKVVHVAPNTSSQIVSKSISKGTGRSSYRGLLKVQKGATGVKSNVRCDALLLDETSRTDTYPYIEIEEEDVEVGHEATVSKVGEEQLFYLMSRGLSESEAYTMIVSGFIEPIAKELPLEYAVELNRLIQLEMAGSVG